MAKKKATIKKTNVFSNTEKTRGGITGKGFMPGNPGGPGRPKGSRNKLEEQMLRDFCEAWEEHGAEVMTAVMADNPADFLKICASLLPKQVALEATVKLDPSALTDAELAEAIASYGGPRAAKTKDDTAPLH